MLGLGLFRLWHFLYNYRHRCTDIVGRVTKILLMMNMDIKIRFLNSLSDEDYSCVSDMERVEQIMSQTQYNGRYTKLGKTLEVKILEPLVFQKTPGGLLKRPVMITILTDGMVSFTLKLWS